MTSQRTERTGAAPHLLRRRITDRVLGGVAGGLGDYFNVDPLLLRIAFVGLMIFGGAGLVLYVVAWLLIPAEGQDASVVEGALRRLGLLPIRVGVLLLIAGVFILFLVIVNGADLSFPSWGQTPNAFWAVAVIAVGALLLRRRDGEPAATAVTTPAHEVATHEVAAPAVALRPRPRSPLAWYVIAAILLAVGLLAIVSQVAEREVSPGQFFGAALAVLGIGLVIGAWWGRARILILVALLLLPLGIVASFVTAPLKGGIGDREYAPVTMAELQDQYRSLGGRIVLDLTNLSSGPSDVHVSASVAVGQLMVVLPRNASIELRTRVGAGDTIVLGMQDVGTSLDHQYVRRHLHQTTYVLDLEAGIGEVYVRSEGSN